MSDGTPQVTPLVWTLGEDRNPYLHNLFVLLECDADDEEQIFDRQRSKLGQQVNRVGKSVHGYDVKRVDVTGADEMAVQAPRFVAGRLLVHTTHRPDKSEFSDALDAVAAHKPGNPNDLLPLAVRDLSELHALLPQPDQVLPGKESQLSTEKLPALFLPDMKEEQSFDF